MRITKELIESLLWEEEGTTLDFKREQYAFVNASNDEKSELLKDILAFTNAFRRSDAFILLGVEEIKGSRSKIVGICSQLDDADLQQFVNSKTQRPVSFSYRAAEHDGVPIAIIHIPQQYRPIYSVKDFGKVKEHVVYVRRGSSTDRARPEEIARMGTDQVGAQENEPRLELSLFDRLTRKPLGWEANLCTTLLQVPEEDDIPNYVEHQRGDGIFAVSLHITGVNSDYFRELVRYTHARNFFRPICLNIRNVSAVTARDVRLVLEIDASPEDYALLEDRDIPEPPSTRQNWLQSHLPQVAHQSEIDIAKTSEGWLIECMFGKIQPKDSVTLNEDLYVAACRSGRLTIKGKIFADNLSEPVNAAIDLQFSVDTRAVSLEEIMEMELQRFVQTPESKKALGDTRDTDVDAKSSS